MIIKPKLTKTEVYLRRLRPQTVEDAANIIVNLPLQQFKTTTRLICNLYRSELERGVPFQEIAKVLRKIESFLKDHDQKKREIWDMMLSQIFNK